LWRLPSPDARS